MAMDTATATATAHARHASDEARKEARVDAEQESMPSETTRGTERVGSVDESIGTRACACGAGGVGRALRATRNPGRARRRGSSGDSALRVPAHRVCTRGDLCDSGHRRLVDCRHVHRRQLGSLRSDWQVALGRRAPSSGDGGRVCILGTMAIVGAVAHSREGLLVGAAVGAAAMAENLARFARCRYQRVLEFRHFAAVDLTLGAARLGGAVTLIVWGMDAFLLAQLLSVFVGLTWVAVSWRASKPRLPVSCGRQRARRSRICGHIAPVRPCHRRIPKFRRSLSALWAG